MTLELYEHYGVKVRLRGSQLAMVSELKVFQRREYEYDIIKEK